MPNSGNLRLSRRDDILVTPDCVRYAALSGVGDGLCASPRHAGRKYSAGWRVCRGRTGRVIVEQHTSVNKKVWVMTDEVKVGK